MSLLFLNSISLTYSQTNLFNAQNTISANVVFLRHALAPGFGDPDNFVLGDCKSQRNINKEGKNQARSLGEYFKKNKIKFSGIFSSEWCRCIDTIREMDIGDFETFSGLNSFFQSFAKKSDVLKKLELKLLEQKKDTLVLLITHQVVISQITGISPKSGGVVLFNSFTKEAKILNLDS